MSSIYISTFAVLSAASNTHSSNNVSNCNNDCKMGVGIGFGLLGVFIILLFLYCTVKCECKRELRELSIHQPPISNV